MTVPMMHHSGPHDSKSAISYKSTHSSRSSVLERAREYNRRIDEQKSYRSKSLEREASASEVSEQRSQSAGRTVNRKTAHERAMASARKENNGPRISVDASTSRGSSNIRASPGSSYSSHVGRPKPTTPRLSPYSPRHEGTDREQIEHNRTFDSTMSARSATDRKSRQSAARSTKSSHREENNEAIVTPELLVDALSGHEDGLLAIAERLMEHYDSGYDVMGEAIIDAFADVQKLFQHVVEAAHMEGAAFEATRREGEIMELRRQVEAGGGGVGLDANDATASVPSPGSPSGPNRHDEFVDQDVKDVLTEAIRKGTALRDANKHLECYQEYEQACQAASSLLPVDSDHRGRLQLSIARAESMTHDRACAILRYAMDDVLRSGLRAGRAPLPDPSKRADVVLSRPKAHPSMSGVTGQAGVVQSSEEALASLVEEMNEVLNAPVYNNTPLQSVARRFLAALADVQKSQQKNEERLEQSLGKLKGEFLLARAEWEEKLNSSQELMEMYKQKYLELREQMKGEGYLDQARTKAHHMDHNEMNRMRNNTGPRPASRTGSVASISSGLAQHARSLVGSFACAGENVRSSGVVAQELAEGRDAELRDMGYPPPSSESRERLRRSSERSRHNTSFSYSERSLSNGSESRSTSFSRRIPHSGSGSTSMRSKSSRSYQEYARSPHRVDV